MTAGDDGRSLANELVRVVVDPDDATLRLDDLAGSGRSVDGLARLVDSGDTGDTYNHNPPIHDTVISCPDAVEVRVDRSRGRYAAASRSWPPTPGPRAPTASVGSARSPPRCARWWSSRRDRVSCASRPRSTTANATTACAPSSPSPPAPTARTPSAPSRWSNGAWWPRAGPRRSRWPPIRHDASSPPAGCSWCTRACTSTSSSTSTTSTSRPAAGALALTLVRATGLLSNGPMPARPLPAGPVVPTPGAQVPGPQVLRYGIAFDAPTSADDPASRWSGAYAAADELSLPLLTLRAEGHGTEPATGAGAVRHGSTGLVGPATRRRPRGAGLQPVAGDGTGRPRRTGRLVARPPGTRRGALRALRGAHPLADRHPPAVTIRT